MVAKGKARPARVPQSGKTHVKPALDLATLAAFQAFDDPDKWHTPVGFVYKDELDKVRVLMPNVEQICRRKFHVDLNVQDATFLTDLGTYEDVALDRGTRRYVVLAIRFSNFGRFFTVWNNAEFESVISPEVRAQIVALVQSYGYLYVDARQIENTIWWSRFFDYGFR